MNIIYYTTEHARVWFKWLTFKFVNFSIGNFPAYNESSCCVICMPWVEPWNYNTNRNNMWENSFIKIYWIQHGFEVECETTKNKNKTSCRYQTTNLLKTWLLFLVCKKGQSEDKSKFLTKSVGIIVMIIFM